MSRRNARWYGRLAKKIRDAETLGDAQKLVAELCSVVAFSTEEEFHEQAKNLELTQAQKDSAIEHALMGLFIEEDGL